MQSTKPVICHTCNVFVFYRLRFTILPKKFTSSRKLTYKFSLYNMFSHICILKKNLKMCPTCVQVFDINTAVNVNEVKNEINVEADVEYRF
jgi:hypothetical protein